MSTPNPTLHLLGKKILFSTLIQYLGKAVQIVLAGFTIKLISNFLSANNYWVYATITEYTLFFSVVANLGIFATVIRKMSVNPTDGKIFVNALYLRIITALIFFSFGIISLLILWNSVFFIYLVAIFFCVLLLDGMTSVCDGMLQANYMMGRATLALVSGRVIALIAIIITIQLVGIWFSGTENFTALALIFTALALWSFATFLLSFYFVTEKIDFHWNIDTQFIWNIFLAGLPFGIINIINSLYFRFLPDYFSRIALTDAQFATFTLSFRIAQILSLLSTFLMFSALPGIREYIEQKHWQKLHLLYKRIIYILIATGMIVVVFGSLAWPTMLEIITHAKYVLPEFWFILPMMLVLAAISYGYDLILIMLFAFDKTKWLLSRECIALSFGLVCFFSSLYIDNIQLKMLTVILWALVGESTMVMAGLVKIHKILRTKT